MNVRQQIAYRLLSNSKEAEAVAKRLAKNEPSWYEPIVKTLDSTQRDVRNVVAEFIRPSK